MNSEVPNEKTKEFVIEGMLWKPTQKPDFKMPFPKPKVLD